MRTITSRAVAGVLASWVLLTGAGGAAAQPPGASAAVREDVRHARALSRAFNHAATLISPSVVHVTQVGTVYVRESFFGPLVRRDDVAKGAGSGVVVTADGYILTNNHVVAGSEKVRVKFDDRRELDGRVIGTDPATDLAVIKVEASDLKPATFGESDDLEIGEWVLAVGSPFGQFDNSVTAGIISAKGRTNLAAATDETNEDYIQTDAAINPGNSGGPLVNLDGQVVGINSQIATRSGGYQGIGFSIPTSIVRPVMDQLVKRGRVDRGGIGVTMAPLTPQNAEKLNYVGPDGVIINTVQPDSPADRAGLKPGDVVVHFNGKAVPSPNKLINSIAFSQPGSTAQLDIVRDGNGMKLDVPIADRNEIIEGRRADRAYGFTVKTVPPQLAQQRFRRRGAVVVETVQAGGPAATTEPTPLEPNDVIVSVNGIPTPDAGAFDRALAQLGQVRLKLDVIRGWETGYIEVPPRK